MDITWLPQQDNYVEGSLEGFKLYIKLKMVSIFVLEAIGIKPEEGKREKLIVDSLYFIDPNRPERTGPIKIMSHEHKAYTVEEMKKVATKFVQQYKSIK